MSNLIKLENVYKYFYTQRLKTTALNNVSLQVDKGEFVAIMGKSGSGKSTLLNTIGLFSNIDSGQFELNGTNVCRISRQQKLNYRRGLLGYVFQSFNLIPDMTVLENVMLPLKFRGIGLQERISLAEKQLEQMELLSRKDHYPSQLSGGQQQRVAIARVMSGKPEIILADEPTGNLDDKTGQNILEILQHANTACNTTIVMVTHSEKAAGVASRQLTMVEGQLGV